MLIETPLTPLTPLTPSTPPTPTKPQLHARKYHCSYNGRRHLPITTWVRGYPRFPVNGDGPELVYEVTLYYSRNRACTLYRSWTDFQRLRSGLGHWRGAPTVLSELDVAGLHEFLRAVIARKKDETAVEYFLRRRMDDCGG